MQRTPVESSNLASVGYDGTHRVLQVEFKNGAIYNYFKVPADKYAALMAADSVGKYLNAEIKPAYTYELVADDAAAQLANYQTQLDNDGVMVGVSRQALDEVGRELHFLRYLYGLVDGNFGTDNATDLYAEKYGWPAPAKYQASQ